jgi:xylan 1,4-beta-xylosidase
MNPILTSRHEPEHPIQKAGHGSLVQTQNGEWYIAYLCSRPISVRKLCPLGRETAIQKCEWTEDGWIRLADGGRLPKSTEEQPNLPLHPFEPGQEKDDFDSNTLNPHFQTLRVPADEAWLSLAKRPGYLRIKGRESLTSLHNQSMVARRIQHYHCDIETCIEFEPNHFTEMAGLICYYDEDDYFYLRISYDDKLKKHLGIITSDQGVYDELTEHDVSIQGWERCFLKVVVRDDKLQFYYSEQGDNWIKIGPALDFGQLSDEYKGKLGFTGAMVGICVQDLSNQQAYADFDYFSYKDL